MQVHSFAENATHLRQYGSLETDCQVIEHMKEGLAMNIKVISYWITTIFTAFELLAGGATDLLHGRAALVAGEPVTEILSHLGYPVYLLTILGIWKVLGALALLAPRLPRLKEWAYAGCFFLYAGAVASGIVRGLNDPGTFIWPPCIFAILTLASWALRPRNRRLGTISAQSRSPRVSASYP